MQSTRDRESAQERAGPGTDFEAIAHLKEAVAAGRHWYVALLEAIGLWKKASETCDGREYRYLVGNEAFDWLLLAERLCEEIGDVIPEQEKEDLLFFSKPPIKLSAEEFRQLMGEAKYRAYLNYWYGVTLEEMLPLVVEEEVRKESHPLSYYAGPQFIEDVYARIYGAGQATLLRIFRAERDLPESDVMGLAEAREFTYWLFRYRLEHCDKARVASDTRKALLFLQRQWEMQGRCPLDEAGFPRCY